MSTVISDLLRLSSATRPYEREVLLHFNYQHLEKQIATLGENSLQRVSPTKKSAILRTGFIRKQQKTSWDMGNTCRSSEDISTIHNIMQLPEPCATSLIISLLSFCRERDALVRLKSFIEIKNQGEKKQLSCSQSMKPTTRAPASTSLPCSCSAVQPPEGTRAMWPLLSL